MEIISKQRDSRTMMILIEPFDERIRLRNDDDYFDRVVVVVIKIKAKERHVLTITIHVTNPWST